MKKLLLPLMVMATMIACNAPEKKAETNAANPEDTETGSYVSMDDKVDKFKHVLEAAMKNDTAAFREVFADTVITEDGISANLDSLGKMKPTFTNLADLLKGEANLHVLYSDIAMTMGKGQVKTFTFTDGRVATGYWGTWSGKGKFTNKNVKVPLHMIAWWEGDKVVKFYRTFDPTALNAEVAASQKK